MAEQLPDSDRGLPRIIVTERVIDKIVQGAPLYPGFETGEAMIGLIVPQDGRLEPDIYILDTISPGENAVRQWGMFEQGSEWQGDVFDWLYVNWEAFRELRRSSYGNALAAKWDVSLSFVGDWHKQPGDMIEPSDGDLGTAHAMIADPETQDQQLVAPIVTMYRLQTNETEQEPVSPLPDKVVEEGSLTESTRDDASPVVETEDPTATPPIELLDSIMALETESPDETIVPPDPATMPSNALVRTTPDEKWLIRIDFWYLSNRLTRFAPVTPVIWANDRLPNLPPISWHLHYSRRFTQEYQLLVDADYVVDVRRWDADGKPPYEMCFYIYKPGSWNVYILVTPTDYPNQMPAMRVSPLVSVADDEDPFEKVYEASRPLLLDKQPDWVWDSKRTLLELVWHIEKTMKKEDEA